MNAYEMTFIVRPDRDEEATRAAIQTVTGRIESAGGEVIATAPWNPPRRRMAYPINEFGDGFYVTTVFRLDGSGLRGIENALKLNENVLRYLVIRASDLNIQQVQQRAQQAYMAAQQQAHTAPQQAAPPEASEEPAPAGAVLPSEENSESVEEVSPTAVEEVSTGEPVEPAVAGASTQAEE